VGSITQLLLRGGDESNGKGGTETAAASLLVVEQGALPGVLVFSEVILLG
jgi:hypothetical protein